jgi:hypothetical protein
MGLEGGDFILRQTETESSQEKDSIGGNQFRFVFLGCEAFKKPSHESNFLRCWQKLHTWTGDISDDLLLHVKAKEREEGRVFTCDI